jgi:hypothetical protein
MTESEVKTSQSARPFHAVDDEVDRRRPGRMAASPTLVSLLRDPGQLASLPELEDEPRLPLDIGQGDGLRPARGIAMGLLISIPLWAALLATVHTMLRLTLHS